METSSRAFSWGSPSRWWEPPSLLPACGLVLPSSAQSLFLYPHIHQTLPLYQVQHPAGYLLQIVFAASLLRVA